MLEYEAFVDSKRRWARALPIGFDSDDLSSHLFPFQRAVTEWALRRGRAAIFADCGLGKTLMQLEWARLAAAASGKPTLILAPLAVSSQTKAQADSFDIDGVHVVRDGAMVTKGRDTYITNYEMLSHFEPEQFGAIVLDESSILKAFGGKVRRHITDFAFPLEYRLACTATPAPNDLIELSNHAEFLGVMSGKEMIALFFTQDGNTTHKWRLKGHANTDFWRWLATWSVAFRKPSNLDFSDDGFELPELRLHEHTVEGMYRPEGNLFSVEAKTLSERREARRSSLEDRVRRAADLVAEEPHEQWLIWCDLNAESEALTRAIPNAVEVRGSDTPAHKAASMLGFANGEVRVLVTKPTIAGFGMNWQNCARMVFVGLSDSYEQIYQATRRCWRFGQERSVDVHIVISDAEGAVRRNIERKERQADEMFSELVEHISLYQLDHDSESGETMREDVAAGDGWELLLGDCIERITELGDDEVGLTVFSPPFPGMYAYTDSPRDVGNVRDSSELIVHFGYLMGELLRVTMPGRNCCIHLAQEPVFKHQAGHVGLKDFRGDVIRAMESHGWIFYGETTIDKDPQVKAARTKEHTLLFKTLSTDSANVRPALADYLLIFKKLGDNPVPVASGSHPKYNPHDGWISPEEWIEWAAPVWYRASPEYPGGIRETDVLNVRQARDERDERHLCPLQLGVIERCIKLWSAPGDLVLSPFAGIGSEGYVALQLGRRFFGIELKESYWRSAAKNLEAAEKFERKQGKLFAAKTGAR